MALNLVQEGVYRSASVEEESVFEPVFVGVDSVCEQGPQIGVWRRWAVDVLQEVGEHLWGEPSEGGTPTQMRDVPVDGIERVTHEAQEHTTEHHADQTAPDQRPGNIGIAGGDVVNAIVALERLHRELHLPAKRVERGDGLGRQGLGGHVGQIEVIASKLRVPHPNQTKATRPTAHLAPIRALVPFHLHLHVKHTTLQTRQHVLKALADEVDGVSARGAVDVGDEAVERGLGSGEEKAALAVDEGEQTEVVVAEVEEEQMALDPRDDALPGRLVAGLALAEADLPRTTVDHVVDEVEFG